MSTSLLSFPRSLWRLYVDYLWNYDATSWVASTAYTFRVLAFLTLLPFFILTALDIASYVIARTLGVIDDTKAATSVRIGLDTPAIVVRDDAGTDIHTDTTTPAAHTPATTPPSSYFRNTAEEGNLRLAGVDLISPAPSQPPSPRLARRELRARGVAAAEEAEESSSSESSYAMLEKERDSGAEEPGLVLRQRVKYVGDTRADA